MPEHRSSGSKSEAIGPKCVAARAHVTDVDVLVPRIGHAAHMGQVRARVRVGADYVETCGVPSCREARGPHESEARRRTRLWKATARANAVTRGMNGPGCSGNGGAASSVIRNASAHGRPARRRRVRLLPREVLPSDYQRISGRSAAQRHAASTSCLPQQTICCAVHMLRELSRHCWSAVSLSHETGRLHWLRLSAAASWFSRSVQLHGYCLRPKLKDISVGFETKL